MTMEALCIPEVFGLVQDPKAKAGRVANKTDLMVEFMIFKFRNWL